MVQAEAEKCPDCDKYGEPHGTIIERDAKIERYCPDCDIEWMCVYPLEEPHREDIIR